LQFRFLLCWLACMALHLFLYFGSQYWEGEPHTVGWRLDERIPVVPGFIYIYCSWFLMLVLVPLALYRADPVTALRYLLADVFDQFISFAVFMYLVPIASSAYPSFVRSARIASPKVMVSPSAGISVPMSAESSEVGIGSLMSETSPRSP